MIDRNALWIAVLSLMAGVFVLVYRGPGAGFVRGHLGDVAIIVFLVAGLATLSIGTPRSRLIGVGAFAVAAELFQTLGLVGAESSALLHVTVGSTFDPLDLVSYGIGLALAAVAELTIISPTARPVWRRSSGTARASRGARSGIARACRRGASGRGAEAPRR